MQYTTNNQCAYEAPDILQFDITVEQGFAGSISTEELGNRLPDQEW